MKSKASIHGHPIHPILVVFPIAFLIGTLIFDTLSLLTDEDSYLKTGQYLEIAGIISALVAAIPGMLDYFFTVPPKSSGKTRATKHALINTSMLFIFLICFVLRINEYGSLKLILGLESLGVILLGIAGWMGGTLVHRNQMGVYNRYANAGKWKEEHFDEKDILEVAASDELKMDQMKLLIINKKRIVLGRTEHGHVAFDDRCTHKGGSLAGGTLICGTVQCPWHGSQFDTASGTVKAGPAKESICTYLISEREGKVYINL